MVCCYEVEILFSIRIDQLDFHLVLLKFTLQNQTEVEAYFPADRWFNFFTVSMRNTDSEPAVVHVLLFSTRTK